MGDDCDYGLTLRDVELQLDRYKEQIKIMIPITDDEEEIKKLQARIDKNAVKLFRAYLVCSHREGNIAKAVQEAESKIKNGCDDKDVLKLLDQMQQAGDAAEDAYFTSLTDSKMRKHELYLTFKEQMDGIYAQLQGKDKGSRPSTATATSSRSTEQNGATNNATTDSPTSAPARPATANKNAKKTKNKRKSRGNTSRQADDSIVEDGIEVDSQGSGASGAIAIPSLDPLTKRPLLDPIKNKYCGHIYGKLSIVDMIQSNRKQRCPYAGCSNIQFIRADHLIDITPEEATAIAKKVKELKKNKPSEPAEDPDATEEEDQ